MGCSGNVKAQRLYQQVLTLARERDFAAVKQLPQDLVSLFEQTMVTIQRVIEQMSLKAADERTTEQRLTVDELTQVLTNLEQKLVNRSFDMHCELEALQQGVGEDLQPLVQQLTAKLEGFDYAGATAVAAQLRQHSG